MQHQKSVSTKICQLLTVAAMLTVPFLSIAADQVFPQTDTTELKTVAVEEAFLGDQRPPRKIVVGEKMMTTVLPGDANAVEIVTAPCASDVTKFAAEELQQFLQKRLKTTIPLVTTPSKNKVSFILGINSWSKEAGIKDDKLCRDAFIIKNSGNKIYILGRDDTTVNTKLVIEKGGGWEQMYEHGTLFGVYDYLERFAEVRFFFPGDLGSIVPQGKALNIPAIDIYDRPDFECRTASIWDGTCVDEKNKNKVDPFSPSISPAKALASHRYRLQTRYVPIGHGLVQFGLVQRFAKSHPEYFALSADGKRLLNSEVEAQICYSSGVMDEIYKVASAFLTGKSAESLGIKDYSGVIIWNPIAFQPGCVGLMPNDGFYECRCAECQKHFKKGPQAASDFVWSQLIGVAERLKKDKIDGKVTMAAYGIYNQVPAYPIPGNMLVQVAGGCWANDSAEDQLIQDWTRKLGHKVWLWSYFNKWGESQMPGIPSVAPQAIGEYYKRQAPYVYGGFMESEVDNWLYHYLNYYVFSKVAWDNNTDINALLKDHYKAMFGPADAVMEKVFNRIEELWVTRIAARSVDTPLGPVITPPSEYELWTKIYSPPEIADLTAAFDQSERLAGKDIDALERVKYIRREFLDPIVRSSLEYRSRNDCVKDFKIGIRPLQDSEKIVIDGKLDESAWKSATAVYLQPFVALPQGSRLVKTEVKVTVDKQNLYIAYDCGEPEMTKVSTTQRQADDPEIWKDNGVEIFLNPSGDRKKYYQIIINSQGALSDQSCKSLGKGFQGDFKWNSETQIKTAPRPGGWIAEIAIPLKNFENFNPAGFTANFCRNQAQKNSVLYTWSPFLRQGNHEPENFGTLVVGELPSKSIVMDGSFEVVPNPKNVFGKWHYDTTMGDFASLDETTFIHGGKSVKLEMVTPVVDKPLYYGVAQTLPLLKPDTRYRISYFAKLDKVAPVKQGGGVVINVMDDKNLWFPHNRLIGTIPWFKQSFEFTSGPKSNTSVYKSYIVLYLLDATGAVWFDDIKLEEVK